MTSEKTEQNLPDYAVLARYEGVTELVEACKVVRDAGFKKWDSYSPFPVHGIDPAMGIKMTRLPWLIFVMGITGTAFGIWLQWFSNVSAYPFMISGKPLWSLPANIPVAFETTVLFAALTAVFATLAINGLPRFHNPLFTSAAFARVTDDKFFIAIQADDPKYNQSEVMALLQGTGASLVEVVGDDSKKDVEIPTLLKVGLAGSFILGLVPLVMISNSYITETPFTSIHLNPNMDFQEKFKVQSASTLFADGASMRLPVEGTVAMDDLNLDAHLNRGLNPDQSWATTFPKAVTVDAEFMAHGKERFEIFCMPCHGKAGDGTGLIHQRAEKLGETAWTQPTNLHQDFLREQAVGRLFNTISNGIRNMEGYAHAIPVKDRWAIIAYVRALQRSQFASADDLPKDLRGKLQ